jgi:hypothetical protein
LSHGAPAGGRVRPAAAHSVHGHGHGHGDGLGLHFRPRRGCPSPGPRPAPQPELSPEKMNVATHRKATDLAPSCDCACLDVDVHVQGESEIYESDGQVMNSCVCPEVDVQGESEEYEKPTNLSWWQISRNASVLGEIQCFKSRGRLDAAASKVVTRSFEVSVRFAWIFTPVSTINSCRSPWFDWLDMQWSIRFQLSPFVPFIGHRRSWFVFVDLRPPYRKMVRINGKIALKDKEHEITIWDFNGRSFHPAWLKQEICTYC